MEVLSKHGRDDLATVFVIRYSNDNKRIVECVQSVQPPRPRADKWVLLVSTLFGCPIKCPMCDAGQGFHGCLSADEIWQQIEFLIKNQYGSLQPPVAYLKVQFARMGEPALNPAVLDVVEQMRDWIHVPRLMPSVSSVAPAGSKGFFERLQQIKDRVYPNGDFQLQFSIHTTDPALRRTVVPIRTWPLEQIAAFGEQWVQPGDRKVTLNFALDRTCPVDPHSLRSLFDPAVFLVKITPLNPTEAACRAGLQSAIDPARGEEQLPLIAKLRNLGYEVLLSIGEVAENQIGSNCGQYLTRLQGSDMAVRDYPALVNHRPEGYEAGAACLRSPTASKAASA